jgi:hypothetical protein
VCGAYINLFFGFRVDRPYPACLDREKAAPDVPVAKPAPAAVRVPKELDIPL